MLEDDFTDKILDFDDTTDLDIRIKPQFYIHNAIIKAQNTLMFSVVKSNISEGLIAYTIFIEHIEVLCRASSYISTDYEKDIQDYKNTEDYKNTKQDLQLAKLSNKKLQLLLTEIFKRSPVNSPLRLKSSRSLNQLKETEASQT
jgi:hypothetical protein